MHAYATYLLFRSRQTRGPLPDAAASSAALKVRRRGHGALGAESLLPLGRGRRRGGDARCPRIHRTELKKKDNGLGLLLCSLDLADVLTARINKAASCSFPRSLSRSSKRDKEKVASGSATASSDPGDKGSRRPGRHGWAAMECKFGPDR